MEDLLSAYQMKKVKATPRQVVEVIDSDDKGRLLREQRGAHVWVACAPGHSFCVSFPDEERLTSSTAPREALHATFKDVMQNIMKHGLKPGNALRPDGRQDVHAIDAREPASKQRMMFRLGAELVLVIRIRDYIRDGGIVRRARNGVLLSGAIPAAYIAEQRTLSTH